MRATETETMRPALAVERMMIKMVCPARPAEHKGDGDLCRGSEAAAFPTGLWGRLPARARRRGRAVGCRRLHVLLDQPALVCSSALGGEQGRYSVSLLFSALSQPTLGAPDQLSPRRRFSRCDPSSLRINFSLRG